MCSGSVNFMDFKPNSFVGSWFSLGEEKDQVTEILYLSLRQMKNSWILKTAPRYMLLWTVLHLQNHKLQQGYVTILTWTEVCMKITRKCMFSIEWSNSFVFIWVYMWKYTGMCSCANECTDRSMRLSSMMIGSVICSVGSDYSVIWWYDSDMHSNLYVQWYMHDIFTQWHIHMYLVIFKQWYVQ